MNSLAGPRTVWQRRPFPLALLLNALASIHFVCFYLSRVPSALDITAYEQGHERSPFQERMLMMGPLNWAHHSALMARAAAALTRLDGWFPAGVSPEMLAQAVIDLGCVVLTGLVVRRIYRASSRTRVLTPFAYPLTLLMIAMTYGGAVSHALRFVFDLPAMAFIAVGFYLIYFRRSPWWFAGLFVAATINRETALLLLPLYAFTRCVPWRARGRGRLLRLVSERTAVSPDIEWQKLWAGPTLLVLLPLAAFWILWHVWVNAHFAGNPTAAEPRLLLNLGTIVCPIAWPQLLSAAAFLWPFTIAGRRSIQDPTLRLWLWFPALWLAFMLVYGLLIETRIFGELIPFFACTTLLIAEEKLLRRAATGQLDTIDGPSSRLPGRR